MCYIVPAAPEVNITPVYSAETEALIRVRAAIGQQVSIETVVYYNDGAHTALDTVPFTTKQIAFLKSQGSH